MRLTESSDRPTFAAELLVGAIWLGGSLAIALADLAQGLPGLGDRPTRVEESLARSAEPVPLPPPLPRLPTAQPRAEAQHLYPWMMPREASI